MNEVLQLVNSTGFSPRFGRMLSVPVGDLVFLRDDWLLSAETDWAGDVPSVSLLLSHEARGEHYEFEIEAGNFLNLPVCGLFFIVRAVSFVNGLPFRVVFELCEQPLIRAV